MQLFIAEKPSLAGGIANYLNKNAGFNLKKKEKCWQDESKETIITWAFGHLLYTVPPKVYDPSWEKWSLDTLPLFPPEEVCRKLPRKDGKEQYSFILEQISHADTVVHCGDPDREGQVLIDELLDEAKKKYPKHPFSVSRLLLNAMDDKSIEKAMENIKDNSEFALLSTAGNLRSTIDWIIGMNGTRYYTIHARKGGYEGIMNVGRVKSPTLNLIVQRELEIKNFKRERYYKIDALLDVDGETIRTQLITADRMTDKNNAQNIANALKGEKAVVTAVERESKKELIKSLYSLDTLQTDANKYYDLSPAATLKALQSLYEKKYTSYPRSDCKYLPISQFEDAGRIVKEINRSGLLQTTIPEPGNKAPSVYNDAKVSAHHAIVPTGIIPADGSLNAEEEKVYLLIVRKYASIWMNPFSYDAENITFTAADYYSLNLKSRHITDPGWKALYQNLKTDESQQEAPDIKHKFSKLETFTIKDAVLKEAETQPPKRYTEGSIITAMNNIKGETEEANAILKEVKGIGTPATRATIIEELEENGLISKEKKALVPTLKGMQLIEILPDKLKKADYTAEIEQLLDDLQNSKISAKEIYNKNKEFVLSFVSNKAPDIINKTNPCPKCGNGYLLYHRFENKDTKEVNEYFRCSNPECKMYFPATGTKVKKPKIVKCPKCGNGWIISKKGKFGVFHSCSNYPECNYIMKEEEWNKAK